MGNLTFIELLKVIVIGIIQGITEWLPISSTGHMILADTFLQLKQPPDFMEMFYVVIQLGSILAVVVLYFNKLNPFALSKTRSERQETFQLWFKVIAAILPIGIGAVSGINIALGGTSVIILVGVALDTVRSLESQMMMRHYKGFLE